MTRACRGDSSRVISDDDDNGSQMNGVQENLMALSLSSSSSVPGGAATNVAHDFSADGSHLPWS